MQSGGSKKVDVFSSSNYPDAELRIGDNFSTGDILLEIETDKATMDVEAQDDGVMAKIFVSIPTPGHSRLLLMVSYKSNMTAPNLSKLVLGLQFSQTQVTISKASRSHQKRL